MLPIADSALTDHSFDLLRDLLQIASVNPPGNESEAADYVATQLRDGGLEPQVLASSEGRVNVVTRLKGTGELPPLLLTGHLDVVPVEPEMWTHPPFDAVIGDDGCLYGRGAVDMKNHVAMSMAVIKRLAQEGVTPKRDLIFAAVADEEQGCRYGSLWLCDNHPDLVRAEYALGEGGGFSLHIGGKCFYPVQVAEKGVCWLKATLRGPPGHGSMPRDDSSVLRFAEKIARLGPSALPAHRTPLVEAFLAEVVDAVAPRIPGLRTIVGWILRSTGLLRWLVENRADPAVRIGLMAMLANTASPTVLRAGSSVNVIPGEASVEIDGRYLPGMSQEDFLAELRKVIGDDVDLEVTHAMDAVETTPWKSPLYHLIEDVMGTRAPGCPVVPYMLPGFTDAKAFDRIGTKWVGFAPVKLPKGMRYADLFHAHDERIPVEGFKWGTEVLSEIVTRWVL